MDEAVGGALAVLGVIFITFLILLGLFGIRYSTTRAGSHTGYVTAVEQDGIFFHNYVVYFKTDNQSSQEDKYCVQESDKDLANQLKQYNKERKLVTIHYDGVRGLGFSLCGGDKITSVE